MENEMKQDELDIGGLDGNEILLDNRKFDQSILYMTDEQHDALVLFDAASHVLDAYTTAPRALAVAPVKQSGKTTLLQTIAMCGWNTWKADPTGPALRAKFNEGEKPLVLIDEISEYYGKNGLRQGPKDLNKILLEGYAKDAKLALSVDRSTVDVSSFCFAAMGGLKEAVRDDIRDRSIVFDMKPVPAGIRLMDALSDDVQADGKLQNARLHQWAREHQDEIKYAFRNFRRPHRKMVSRLRQIWGPLYAVALVAGGDWPQRCVNAFKAMALDASEQPVLSKSQMILRDSAKAFTSTGAERMFTRDIAAYLRSLPEISLYQDLSNEGLARSMSEALGAATAMTIGTQRAKGFRAAPILSAWVRLEAKLNPPDEDDVDDDEFGDFFEVTEITSDDIEHGNENDPSPAESRQSPQSPVISGTEQQDLSKEEPENSVLTPPCEQDDEEEDKPPRKRKPKSTIEDRFVFDPFADMNGKRKEPVA